MKAVSAKAETAAQIVTRLRRAPTLRLFRLPLGKWVIASHKVDAKAVVPVAPDAAREAISRGYVDIDHDHTIVYTVYKLTGESPDVG